MPKRKMTPARDTDSGDADADVPPPSLRTSARVVKLTESVTRPQIQPSGDVSSSPSTSGSGSESDSDSEPNVPTTDEEDGENGHDAGGRPSALGEDEDEYDDINVEFEFFDPKEADFLGLKALLHNYLDGQAYDCSGLVDTIIKQTAVGTVVKTSEDDDAIAIMTVLNTSTQRGEQWLKDVRAFLVAHCPTAAQRQILTEALDQAGTGLLLNERLINSPPSLGPPLTQFLLEEVDGAAQDDEASQRDREEFQLQRYLLCTRTFLDPGAPGPGQSSNGTGPRGNTTGSQQGSKRQRKQVATAAAPAAAEATIAAGGGSCGLVYIRPEDEFLHQQAAWSFTFPVEGRAVSKGDLQPMRLVMCVPAERVPLARRELDQVVGNMAAQD